MKKTNTVISLRTGCALKPPQALQHMVVGLEPSYKNWSLSARKRNTQVRCGLTKAQSRAQL